MEVWEKRNILENWSFIVSYPINSFARHKFKNTLEYLTKFLTGFALEFFFQIPSGIFRFPRGRGNLLAYFVIGYFKGICEVKSSRGSVK